MTGNTRALAFAKRVTEESSLRDATVRAICCCSDQVAILYHPGGESDFIIPAEREEAFLCTIEIAEVGTTSSDISDRVFLSDLRMDSGLSFSFGTRGCLHFFLPVSYIAMLLRFHGDTSALHIRNSGGRSNLEIRALVETLTPILRQEQASAPSFIDNVVLAGAHLIIERYVGERSATSFERNQMSAMPLGNMPFHKNF
ncbi:hypothetical protein QTL95_16805 [Rhizobium sp. S152]|uniref:hypothetical protein n=1 Tax=Rhizobium sp. S152 TaxID=3055038 RepID=UPI0025A999E1|nr:hypothetical protein [Rhizobium sp. S152]MDM9627566.1 hypothetical protein [Rhizobium sp. S152]